MFWRLLLRSVLIRWRFTLLGLLAITVASTLISCFLLLEREISRKMYQELRRYGPNVLLKKEGFTAEDWFDRKTLEEIQSLLPRDSTISPFFYHVATVRGESVVLVGIDPEATRRLYPYWHLEGDWVKEGEAACMIGSKIAERFNVGVGDLLFLRRDSSDVGDSLLIAGVVTTGGSEEAQIFTALPTAWHVAGRGERFHLATLRLPGTLSEIESFSENLLRLFPQMTLRVLYQIARSEEAFLRKITFLMRFIAAGVLFLSLVCVAMTYASILSQRHHELALLRSLGAALSRIRLLLLSEQLFLGFLGGSVGYGAGFLFAFTFSWHLFKTGVSFRPLVGLEVVGLAMATVLFGSVLPLERSLAIPPSSILREE